VINLKKDAENGADDEDVADDADEKGKKPSAKK
jgi:hypothetical protein